MVDNKVSLFKNSVLGVISKVVDAAIKFITIPLLIGYYGKLDYGLIALSFSLNAYLRLLDLGINVGTIRFFSIWFKNNENEKIVLVSQTSIIFYGIIGTVNAFIFIFLGYYSDTLFKLELAQYESFRWMMYILAISSILNWVSFVFLQLLSAKEKFITIYTAELFRSILLVISAILAVYFKLSLPVYFLLFTISTLSVGFIYFMRLSDTGINPYLLIRPKWNTIAFKEVFHYSMAIFILGVFQLSARELRPILLTTFASDGLNSVTDFRILQTITGFIMVIGGVFMQLLLPIASRNSDQKGNFVNQKLAYKGTKYITIVLSYVVFIIVIFSKEILLLFLGPEYVYLSNNLIVWSVTILLFLHNSPVASMALASGKTKPLIYSTAIGAVISIIITIVLAPSFNVGAAVFGYFIYILIQMFFYYLYFIPKVLKLRSSIIFFKSFMPGILFTSVAAGITLLLSLLISDFSMQMEILIKMLFFTTIWIILIRIFVVKMEEVYSLIKNRDLF
jgi:O-antigen/teichoic acid export membrane protein